SLAALFSAVTNSVYQNRLESRPPRRPVGDGCDAILNEMDDRNDIQEPSPTAGDTQPLLDTDVSNVIQITVPVGMLHCNCTIMGDPASREAIVVDPGDEVGRILELIGRHRLTVKGIVSTHAHIDHVGGLAKLQRMTGAPVLMHREDLPLYQAMDVQAAFLGVV